MRKVLNRGRSKPLKYIVKNIFDKSLNELGKENFIENFFNYVNGIIEVSETLNNGEYYFYFNIEKDCNFFKMIISKDIDKKYIDYIKVHGFAHSYFHLSKEGDDKEITFKCFEANDKYEEEADYFTFIFYTICMNNNIYFSIPDKLNKFKNI